MYNVSISTNNLTIGYPARVSSAHKSTNKVIQRDLTFTLYAGEMVCMLGANGCGKSTLLRTLAGLQPALSGEFSTLHNTHSTNNSSQMAIVLTERLSMDNTTVHDVVALGRYPYTSFLGGLTEEDERIIAEALQQVGIAPEAMHTFFNDHSDGEKQRVLIAKALAQQTPIILLDEPTAHLDLPHRILILKLLRQLAREQSKTVLISTHELELALATSDRILLMHPRGKGVQLDTPDALRASDAFTKAFGMNVFSNI